MAHSIQTVGDNAVIFRDGELMDLIALLREELERTSTGYARSRPIVAQWREQLRNYGPGTIDFDLDKIVTSPEDTAELLSLLGALRQRLSALTAIPQATLQALSDVPDVVYRGDVPASSVVETIDKLSGLLTAGRRIHGR
jgi:hypothetical protein